MSNRRKSRIHGKWAHLALASILFLTPAASPARASQPDIHPDCVTNPHPVLCTHMVNELIEELANFNEAFINPDPVGVASFYHPQAIAYTSFTGRFFVGRESILNDAIIPLLANIRTITADFQDFHFSVINPLTIVTYGSIPATGVHKDGRPISQPPLPQILTWTRNDAADAKRPFLIMSDQE